MEGDIEYGVTEVVPNSELKTQKPVFSGEGPSKRNEMVLFVCLFCGKEYIDPYIDKDHKLCNNKLIFLSVLTVTVP